ncbi:MAG TPA: pilus assembly protein PilM [Verrucomicrobiae bacterium]|nr:pilus assembly protein PilM [Verrucomicrobiae bacterium]
MKPFFNPRKLTHIGQTRGCAAVAFGVSSLELTTARTEGGDVQVLQNASANAAAPENAENPAPQWAIAAQSLRRQFDPREHRVVTSINCEDVLCQSLRLPATDPTELKQILDLQIDSLTPLPLEEIVYGFEPLESFDGQTRVLVVIAPKVKVNERVEVLETAGLPAEIVSVDALAMFHALSQRNTLPTDDRLNVLVSLGATSANVIVYSQNVPFAVRSMVFGPGAVPGGEGESLLREELQRTLVAAEAEHPQRGVGSVTFLATSEELKSLAERVGAGLSVPSNFLTNGAVPSPALSLCLHCAAEASLRLNLLPDEWRSKRRAAAFRKHLIRGAIALGAVYALALGTFLGLLAVRTSRLNRLEKEAGGLQPFFLHARQTESELVTMRNQLGTKYSALEVLREVTLRMPEGVRLSEFAFKKDQTVGLKGQAPSASVSDDYVSQLEKSELFSQVTPNRTSTEAGGLTKFDLVCTLKTATGVGTTPP